MQNQVTATHNNCLFSQQCFYFVVVVNPNDTSKIRDGDDANRRYNTCQTLTMLTSATFNLVTRVGVP